MGMFGAYLIASLFQKSKDDLMPDVPRYIGMNYMTGGYNPIYIPRRGKFKGWMRERRRCTFNKNK